ncbi:MAG: CPBP family intramembrane glutamic endopeptidase, partial [Candidatus Acidoferrales bacterium]
LALLVVFASALVPPPEKLPFDKLFSSQSAAWLIIGLALLLAPIVEEMVFRGYIYTLLETRFGVAPAVLVSGLLFGAWHFPQYYPGYFQMFLICVVGLAFSLVRAGSRTLLASILAHFAYNATVSLHFLASEQFRSLPALFF